MNKILKFLKSKRELFKINYKPIKFKVFSHLNGSVTLAFGRRRLKIWGWRKND